MTNNIITVRIYKDNTGEVLEYKHVEETPCCYGNTLKYKFVRKARNLGFLKKGETYRVEMWSE